MTGTSALVASEDIDLWKDYLKFHLVEHYSSVLPEAVAAEHFAFYGTILSGTQQMPDRSQDAVLATNAALGQAVGQLYTERYFPPEAKAKAEAMVADIIAAYRVRISNLTWMSPQTKEKALAKLAALRIGLGYPDKWIDYSTLDVVRGDAFGNMRRAEAFNRSGNLAKLRAARRPRRVEDRSANSRRGHRVQSQYRNVLRWDPATALLRQSRRCRLELRIRRCGDRSRN